ncbi:hypothetical protein [Acrocarpospora sp. B8E8]|uniref:hypothetical protein n=1 Tax=Acrocarpospora sp. B8E8 TaxID=3153572 RepID=UPI00325E39E8
MDGSTPTGRNRPKRPRSRGNPRAILIGVALVAAAVGGGGVVYAMSSNDTPVTQPAPTSTTSEDATAPLADDPAEDPAESGEPDGSTEPEANPAGGDPGNSAQGGQADPPAQNSTTKKDKPTETTPKTPATTKPKPTTGPTDNPDEIDRGSGAGAVEPGGPVGGY